MLEIALCAGAVGIGLLFFLKKRRASVEELDSYYDSSEGERFAHKWGYTDTRFEFVGPSRIRVSGSRYPLAGYELPGFIPFGEEVLGQPLQPENMAVAKQDQPVPEPRLNQDFIDAVSVQIHCINRIGTITRCGNDMLCKCGLSNQNRCE